jgi:ribosomal protein S18 acetylase RimI-like enzyme
MDDDLNYLVQKGRMLNRTEQNDYRFDYQENPDANDERILFDGINQQAIVTKNVEKLIKSFGIFIKDPNENVVGGVKGSTYYGCLYVDMLWLKEELRHKGFGTRLMEEAEKIGREQKCSFAAVNTMDWEALIFYQKLGYVIEFVRDGYEKQSKMYLLRKNL